MDTILVVEDEQDIADLVTLNLQEIGLTVDHCLSGEVALEKLKINQYDLVMLDVMLPGISGLDVCRQLREQKPEQVILMVTSRNSEIDRVLGLELGADDYMTKPVAIKEFQARLKALLRRTSKSVDNQIIESLGIKLNLATHQLSIDGKLTSIGTAEFNLLKFFLTHKNRVYSRSQLLDFVWGQGVYLEERTVDVHMLRLRKVLKPYEKHTHFITVRGMGYMFSDGNIE